MLSKLQQFFNQHLNHINNSDTSLEHRLHLACAVLMVEMINVDSQVTTEEQIKIQQLLQQKFQLNSDEIYSLVELANNEKHNATDYYEFTSLLNRHYTQQQKIKLVEDLWALAYADEKLDKYEEHLVRQLADLLHVPHSAFIKTKHNVKCGRQGYQKISD